MFMKTIIATGSAKNAKSACLSLIQQKRSPYNGRNLFPSSNPISKAAEIITIIAGESHPYNEYLRNLYLFELFVRRPVLRNVLQTSNAMTDIQKNAAKYE
jgi:hypothetical protein